MKYRIRAKCADVDAGAIDNELWCEDGRRHKELGK